MGHTIKLETEYCEPLKQVYDPSSLLHSILPAPDDEEFELLRYIDYYGDTTFNSLQLPVFIREWDKLDVPERSTEERDLLRQIRELAEEALSEPHLYLKFSGD